MSGSLRGWAARTSRRTRIAAAVTVICLAILTWAVITGHVVVFVVFMVAGAATTGITVRVVKVGKVIKADVAKVRGRTQWPLLLRNTLNDGEKAEYETRMHPIVIFYNRWVVISVAAFVVTLVASLFIWIWLLLVTTAALLGLVVAAAPGAVNWWFTRWSFTDQRIIRVTGIFSKKFDSVVLSKIETASYTIPFISLVLVRLGLPGAWHWRIDTLTQKDPFNDLWWLNDSPIVKKLVERHALPDKVPEKP